MGRKVSYEEILDGIGWTAFMRKGFLMRTSFLIHVFSPNSLLNISFFFNSVSCFLEADILNGIVGICTLIKKKTKFSSYIRKFGWDRVQSNI